MKDTAAVNTISRTSCITMLQDCIVSTLSPSEGNSTDQVSTGPSYFYTQLQFQSILLAVQRIARHVLGRRDCTLWSGPIGPCRYGADGYTVSLIDRN